jgi:nucleotide-binding universal stress UspA family protein
MKHKLLVAVDGEKTTAKTVTYVGRACAGETDADFGIAVLHVLPVEPVLETWQMARVPERSQAAFREYLAAFRKETKEAGLRLLAEMKELLVREGVPAERITTELAAERGNVAPQILNAARAHGCDTIVVGRRGKSMIGQFFLGSVVEHLLRNPTGFTIWVVE